MATKLNIAITATAFRRGDPSFNIIKASGGMVQRLSIYVIKPSRLGFSNSNWYF